MDLGEIFYLTLVVSSFVGVMALVGIVSSYLSLRVLGARFGTCPNCHRRDAGRIIESETVDSRSHMDFKRSPPARVTIKTLEDRWQCQHCGHEWTKTLKETDRVVVRSSK